MFDVIDDAVLYEAVLMMLFVSKMTPFDAAPGWTKMFQKHRQT